MIHANPLPTFVYFNFPQYIISPKTSKDLGTFIVKGNLANLEESISFEFKISVINQTPLLTLQPKDMAFIIGDTSKEINLGEIKDPDGDSKKVKIIIS